MCGNDGNHELGFARLYVLNQHSFGKREKRGSFHHHYHQLLITTRRCHLLKIVSLRIKLYRKKLMSFSPKSWKNQNSVAFCNRLATEFSLKPLLEATQGTKNSTNCPSRIACSSAVLTLPPSPPTAQIYAKKNSTLRVHIN